MRSAKLLPDGTMEVARSLQAHFKHRDLYLRFRAGESFADIGSTEKMTIEDVKQYVTIGRKMYEGEQLLELRDLKHQSAIENERIRKKARERNEVKILDGLDLLLSGKRTLSSVDKQTGEILTQDIVDPEVISMGLEHARKIISLDERPAQSQTYVNIQNNQNNNGDAPQGNSGLSYEERLVRIRNAQNNVRTIERVESDIIDVTPESIVETGITEESKEEGWGDF